MKLIIQIPCYNEEATLAQTLADLPREIEGIDRIETLVIDDGSDDRTVEVARRLGVDYIQRNRTNLGLAATFQRGLDACLQLDADLIVNTDGDNQYCGKDIARLVEPIVRGEKDYVVGCRDIAGHPEFPRSKKLLQRVGSRVVNILAGVKLPDTTSGFRAMNRATAARLCVMSRFSYTLETLIQAGRGGFRVGSVPIRVNPKTRPSRLFRSPVQFISRQLRTMTEAFIGYCPVRFFMSIAALLMTIGTIFAARVGYFMFLVEPALQKFKTGSGIAVAICTLATMLCILGAVIGFMQSRVRQLSEENRYLLRHLVSQQDRHLFHMYLIVSPELGRWKTSTAEKAEENGIYVRTDRKEMTIDGKSQVLNTTVVVIPPAKNRTDATCLKTGSET